MCFECPKTNNVGKVYYREAMSLKYDVDFNLVDL